MKQSRKFMLAVMLFAMIICIAYQTNGRAEAGNVLQDAVALIKHTQGYDLNRRVANLEFFAESVASDRQNLQKELETLKTENTDLKAKVERLQSIVSYLSCSK